MKYILTSIVLFLLMTANVFANSFIVMDSEDGTVYKQKNSNTIQSIASVSKVMTAIIAIEKGDLSDSWIVKDEIKNSYGSSVYLVQNQQVQLIDLLYGLLLESGNDAADAIAYHVGGNNTSQFIIWMNEKASELQMKDTLYRNPSGLDDIDGGNLSTVYDQAILMKYCLENDVFLQISKTKYYTNQYQQQYVNHNKLLWSFNYTISGKTGYTVLAQHTLVSAAKKDDITCIVVSFDMGEEAKFHQQQYVDFYNHINSYTIIHPQVSKIDNKYVKIEEPFVIHATDEEFETGEFKIIVESNGIQVEWKTNMRTKCMYYSFI